MKHFARTLRFLLTSLIVAWLLAAIALSILSLIGGPHPECGVNPSVGACSYWERTSFEIVHMSPLPLLPFFLVVILIRLILQFLRDRRESSLHDANFYFYFAKDNKSAAKKAEKELAQKGFKTDLHWLDYEEGRWSLALNEQVSGLDEVVELEKGFKSMAQKYNAEYGGHEIAV